MSLKRMPPCALFCALVLLSEFSFATPFDSALHAAQAKDAKTETDQEVLKLNAECNAAQARNDVSAMDKCETDDFTFVHANGEIEHKTEYLNGIASGDHKFLSIDLSDVRIRSYGNSAIVEGHMHLKADNKANNGKITDVQNYLIIVWVKQQGTWRQAAWIAHLLSRLDGR